MWTLVPLRRYFGRCATAVFMASQIATALIVSVTAMGQVSADVSNDIVLQHGSDQYRRSAIDPQFYSRIGDYLEQGYPPASVMLHGVSLGVPLEDIVEMSVRYDVANAQYYYDLASSLLPSLPGWVCRSNDRYHPLVDSNSDASSDQTLAQVAERFFAGHSAGRKLPDWRSGERHLDVPLDELSELTQSSTRWYQSSGSTDAKSIVGTERPVFVSLYREDQEIRTDLDSQKLQAARAAGRETLPVVLLFNETYQEAVSELGENASVSNIAEEFFGNGRELTSVPDWSQGDYHVQADVEELNEIFEIPTRQMVSAERWNKLQQLNTDTIDSRPFKVTMLQDGERLWVDEPERLAVAMEAGATSVPIVFYFHSLDRNACGVQSNQCQARLCDAAIAGGGDASMCNRSAGGEQIHQSDATGSPVLMGPSTGGALSPPSATPTTPVQPPVQPIPPSSASPS